LPSELLGPLFAGSPADAELSDRALLAAMLDAERALAVALAGVGIVPEPAAAAIAAACHPDRFDPADLGRRAVAAGNPVVPLVRDLTAAVAGAAGPAAARWVHHGATSQDIMDTAASLVASRALGPVLDDLAGAADAAAGLADRHRATVMAARTLGQQALPTTFGLKAAGWLAALDDAADRLDAIRRRRLAAQLGGAAGTLAALGGAGAEVAAGYAAELGLAEPVLPWHTNRVRVGELAAALGVAGGAMAKVALDVTLLAQTELGEVSEAAGEGRGGSSTLPHKRNPVTAVLVTAATRRVPGLVATLLGAMAQEQERATGAWHAEWEPLTELLRLAGGAAARTRELLDGLEVHPERMRANLEATGGLLLSERVAGALAGPLGRADAQELVRRLGRRAAGDGQPLRAVLLQDPTVRRHLDQAAVDRLLDPEGYLGSAGRFVDRALAAHRALRAARRTPGDPATGPPPAREARRVGPEDTIGTERLVLAPLRPEDADELAEVLADPRLHEFIGGRPATPEELRARYAAMVAGPGRPGEQWRNWTVRRRGDLQAVGTVQATLTGGEEGWTAVVAWVVGVPWQGRGYASEAARALVGWLGGRGVAGIQAHIHPDHLASARVATRAGFEPTPEEVDGEQVWRIPTRGE
jgi:3-carboxy-cis,cis-muconate cycloisomerase